MGTKVAVARSFEAEVAKAFAFLVAEHGLSRPAGVGPALVCYTGDGLDYRIRFDEPAAAVTTTVSADLGPIRLTADLPALVAGAALGPPAMVPHGARTLAELRTTVARQAALVRRLQPYLTPLNVLPLMRAAHAREYRPA